MTLQEIRNRVLNILTGGRQVELEVDPKSIDDCIQEAFERVRGWYLETRIAETLFVNGDPSGIGSPRYIARSAFVRPIRQIYKIYDIENVRSTAGAVDSRLMGIQRSIIESPELITMSYYIQYATLVDNMLARPIDYFLIPDKVLISGYLFNNYCTVVYYPEPADVTEVTVQKAIDWMLKWAIARVKYSTGRVRSKFRGGDLNLENDGEEIITEANTEMEKLEEDLKNLDLHLN